MRQDSKERRRARARGTLRLLRMRARPVKPRYWRAQERPRPPIPACRWPRRAGVSRGGHHWRARRSSRAGSGAEGSNAGRRQERSGSANADIGHHQATSPCAPWGRRCSAIGCSHHRLIRDHLVLASPCHVFATRERRALGRVGRARSARRVLPASPRHALRVQSAGTADGHEGRATWVTVPIAIVALRRDAARTAALATRLFSPTASSSPRSRRRACKRRWIRRSHGTGGRRRRCIACQQGANDAGIGAAVRDSRHETRPRAAGRRPGAVPRAWRAPQRARSVEGASVAPNPAADQPEPRGQGWVGSVTRPTR
jgi:hypothetical protein